MKMTPSELYKLEWDDVRRVLSGEKIVTYKPASQQAPADHPDLVSEAEAFLVRKYGIPLKNFRGHHKQWARDIAEFARQQATSPDAVIDEFVRRANDRCEVPRSYENAWALTLIESVAAEMKGEKK